MRFSITAKDNAMTHSTACLPLIAAFCALACLAPTADAAVELARVDTVEGHKLETLTIRNPAAKATVVFENGSRATLAGWDKVLDGVKGSATVFAYNRPGYANSEATSAPRDGATIVEQLRATLRRKGLQPPYVLVGHSLGGLYMQLFARRYPEEVQGLVLVDALYPRVVKKPQEFPLYSRAGKWLFFSRTVTLEMRAGSGKEKALRNLALRTGVEDVDSLVKMLIQADRFGTSVGTALRVQSEQLRTRRRQLIEENAAKIATKLLFPLIFFIFPALLVVLLGPACLQILRAVIPVMAAGAS